MSQTYNLYVSFVETMNAPPPWGELKYWLDYTGTQPAPSGGNIDVTVARGDSVTINWFRVQGEDWTFHDLTIHPRDPGRRGVATPDQLNLRWALWDDHVQLVDQGGGSGIKRQFNYTLALDVPRTRSSVRRARLYFDPELVDLGGE